MDELDSRQWGDGALVVLHNAASPNTPTELVRRCLAAAADTGAAQAYIPCQHTVVRLVDDTVDSVFRATGSHTPLTPPSTDSVYFAEFSPRARRPLGR